mgnify:CR=1 FL=1
MTKERQLIERTRLIQRLKKPTGNINPFAFGGGRKNGGLSDKTAKLLNQIWSFDYMGAAEFEHGKVSEALQRIADYSARRNTAIGTIELIKPVFYLCEKGFGNSVEKVITQLAEDEKQLNPKERSYLFNNLRGGDHFKEYVGWLELDNAFAFFTDRQMYDATLGLFKAK